MKELDFCHVITTSLAKSLKELTWQSISFKYHSCLFTYRKPFHALRQRLFRGQVWTCARWIFPRKTTSEYTIGKVIFDQTQLPVQIRYLHHSFSSTDPVVNKMMIKNWAPRVRMANKFYHGSVFVAFWLSKNSSKSIPLTPPSRFPDRWVLISGTRGFSQQNKINDKPIHWTKSHQLNNQKCVQITVVIHPSDRLTFQCPRSSILHRKD